jgi:hypothetical protein
MNINRYIIIIAMLVAAGTSCRDESLYPLPYAEKDFGGYIRLIRVTSNVIDQNNISGSAFEAELEAVDELNGDNLQEIEFYISHRRGSGLTDEVLYTTVSGGEFSAVPEPTISIFKRLSVRFDVPSMLTALQSLSTDPDGTGALVAFPGAPLQAADQIILRWVMVLKNGKRFSVLNPQASVNAAFAKVGDANTTPNVTGGQFYSSPFIYTLTVRPLIASSWIGDYALTQTAIWSTSHTWNQHEFFPARLNEVLFPNQTVTLTMVPNGLSTERQFTVTYRGQSTTMRINLENGTVFVPLQNTGITCASDKFLFWTTPTAGNFTLGTFGPLAAGLPQATTANRGVYSATSTGLTAGNTLIIGLDDDADEYGLRNGYCSWTRRIKLQLTKL